MDEPTAQNRAWLWACKKYCPNLVVYLPKYVTVQNPKLGLLNSFNSLLVLLFTFYYFYTNNNYILKKEPTTTLAMCDNTACGKSAVEHDLMVDFARTNETYCSGNNIDVTYIESGNTRRYRAITCAGRCGGSSPGGSCINSADLIETTPSEVFIPTFYQESFSQQPGTGNSCPTGFGPVLRGSGSSRYTVCEKTANYFVAGSGESSVVFNHEFLVTPHSTILDMFFTSKDKKSHSGSFHSNGWEKGMTTILFDATGNIKGTYEQSNAASITLKDLLRAASLGETTDASVLDLDARYTSPETGVSAMAPIRLTGAHLTVDLWTTDTGVCPVFDVFRKSMRKIKVESGRPVTCLTVFAERRWLSKETAHPVATGGVRTRKIHGIRVSFRTMGNFEFSDDKAIFRNITVFFVWIKVPLALTTTFCLLFLGKLSEIYGRVLSQELNLKDACKGLMARLLHYSSAFQDLQDHEKGISKQRIYDRMKDFLLDNEDIDDDELNRFVEFVFDGLKGTGHHLNSDKNYVSLQEFCEVCSNNEPLNFQALVELFDNDRKLGALESFFLDPSLKDTQKYAPKETLKIEPIDFTKVKHPGATHSRVETAAVEVESMLKELKVMEAKAARTAGELEIGDDIKLRGLNDIDMEPVPAKLDQRESFCSIADEEDECGGGPETKPAGPSDS